MFHLLSSPSPQYRPVIWGVYTSFDEAVAAAYALLPVAHFEADADHPGCADLFTEHGSIYSIEPAARRAA